MVAESILAAVTVTDIAEPAIHVLSAFKALTKCQLQAPDAQPFSIKALHALPQLRHLELQDGTFCAVNAAQHLTSLKLWQCQAFCSQSCPCVTSLLQLSVGKESCLADFHAKGVCACSVLQNCHSSLIGAEYDHTESLELRSTEVLQIPAGMSALAALTRLALTHTDQTHVRNFGWLAQIPKLRSLRVTVDLLQPILPPNLSVLSNMTCLHVANWSPQASGNTLVDFDWKGFGML